MTILKQERVSNLIMEFMELHPRVQVSLRVGPPREALESIEYGIADFALLALARRPEKFLAVRLGTAPFILVTPKRHGFDLDRMPTREQLRRLPFVTYMGDDGAEIHTPFLAEEKLDGLTGRTVRQGRGLRHHGHAVSEDAAGIREKDLLPSARTLS